MFEKEEKIFYERNIRESLKLFYDVILYDREIKDDYEIYPGTFWLDNSIVKAYDKKGNLKYLYKVMIADDLSVTFKKHSNCPDYTDFNFETWEETAKRIKPVFNLPVLYT